MMVAISCSGVMHCLVEGRSALRLGGGVRADCHGTGTSVALPIMGTACYTFAMPRTTNDTTVGLRLGAELKQQLEEAAAKEDLSMSQLVRKALRRYLEGQA